MTDYFVAPDLYEGSALTTITEKIRNEIKGSFPWIKVVNFGGSLKCLGNGNLDDPNVFFDHNIDVLRNLRNSIKSGDRILFGDFFQPGIFLLKYFWEGMGMNIKFGSLFHGASFVKGDFFEKKKWMNGFEKSLIDIMDKIYVPSSYTSSFFDKALLKRKVVEIPFDFNPDEFQPRFGSKKYDVIFPHRWSSEKDPELLIELAKRMPEVKFAVSGIGENSDNKDMKNLFNEAVSLPNVKNLGIKTGKEHYENLKDSKIVLGTQDTFGYSMREAMSCGCIPVAKNEFCYVDFLPRDNLFDDLEGAIVLIKKYLEDYPKGFVKPNKTDFKVLLKDFFDENGN